MLDADALVVPVDAVVDQVIGPIYFRTLIAGVPIDDAFVDSVVGIVVRRQR